jgi:bifunctional DNase/RNase
MKHKYYAKYDHFLAIITIFEVIKKTCEKLRIKSSETNVYISALCR